VQSPLGPCKKKREVLHLNWRKKRGKDKSVVVRTGGDPIPSLLAGKKEHSSSKKKGKGGNFPSYFFGGERRFCKKKERPSFFGEISPLKKEEKEEIYISRKKRRTSMLLVTAPGKKKKKKGRSLYSPLGKKRGGEGKGASMLSWNHVADYDRVEEWEILIWRGRGTGTRGLHV